MKKNNSSVVYILNIAIRLVVICAVIALLVATVNYYTAPVIEENNRIATANAISALFGNKENISYEEIKDVSIPEDQINTVDTIYSVKDSDGVFLGYSVKLSPTGFKGDVDLITAFDTDGFIIGVEITSTNDETSGIGTKVASKDFTNQFIETADNQISDSPEEYIISGATKTSKPVSQSIITAKSIISKLISNADNNVELTPNNKVENPQLNVPETNVNNNAEADIDNTGTPDENSSENTDGEVIN